MGFKIKEIRESKGMSQQELSTKSGISRLTIISLESGTQKTTTTKTLLKIANALGVSVQSIFFEESV